VTRGVDLDADPLAVTDKMKNQMKATGIGPQIRRRNSSAIPNFAISNEKRSFIRTWVRVQRRGETARLTAEQYRKSGAMTLDLTTRACDPRFGPPPTGRDPFFRCLTVTTRELRDFADFARDDRDECGLKSSGADNIADG
jgi:hypothetical protein